MPVYQHTIRYRTYIKETIIEALRDVFDDHPDPLFNDRVSVTPELPTTRSSYPSIIVRYYSRGLNSAGIAHHEWLKVTEDGVEPKLFQRFRHFFYKGDIELKVLALSSKDRDFLIDGLVQAVGMSDSETYTEVFHDRVYDADVDDDPQSKYHFINLATEGFEELPDQEAPAPWMEEDLLVYSGGIRVPIFGEFYSRDLTDSANYGVVTAVEVYPWIPEVEEEPDPNPEDPAPWIDSGIFYSE
jgi:hypothetical protein